MPEGDKASRPYRGSRRVFAGIRLKRWNVLARFVDDGRLCMSTNAAENLAERSRALASLRSDPRSPNSKASAGEVAHAGGEVEGSPAGGDLDLAPGPIDIEEDEQLGGSVALVLAIVALTARDRPPAPRR